MFRHSNTTEVESPLEATARQYARLGWHVTSRTTTAITLARESGKTGGDDTPVRLTAQADGQITVEGPPLPTFALEGRTRAWLLLLTIAVLVFALAWALGFFN